MNSEKASRITDEGQPDEVNSHESLSEIPIDPEHTSNDRANKNVIKLSNNTDSDNEQKKNNQSSIQFNSAELLNNIQAKTLDQKTQDTQERNLKHNSLVPSKLIATQPFINRHIINVTISNYTKANLSKECLSTPVRVNTTASSDAVLSVLPVLENVEVQKNNIISIRNDMNNESTSPTESIQEKDKNQPKVIPNWAKEVMSRLRVVKPIIVKPSNKLVFKINGQNIQPSCRSVSAEIQPVKNLHECVKVLVLNSAEAVGQSDQPSIKCIIINDMDKTQLKNTLDNFTKGKQLYILKEITLKQPASLLTTNEIKNKLLSSVDMLAIFGFDWLSELSAIAATNLRPMSVDQWLFNKFNLQKSNNIKKVISLKNQLAFIRKQDIIQPYNKFNKLHIKTAELNPKELFERVLQQDEESEHTTVEMPLNLQCIVTANNPLSLKTETSQNKMLWMTIEPLNRVPSQLNKNTTEQQLNQIKEIKVENENKDITIGEPLITLISSLSTTIKEEPTLNNMFKPVSPLFKELQGDNTKQERITRIIRNKNVTPQNKSDNVNDIQVNRVLHIVHSEKSKENGNLIILGGQPYNQNIPIPLSDDDQDDNGIKDEGIETAEDSVEFINSIERGSSGGLPKKGELDKIILDKLDALDQFGVDVSGKGISYEVIAKMKKMLIEGKVERYKGTIGDVEYFRHRYKKQLNTACHFCCVNLNSNLENHMQMYHTNAAGSHVCDICNRHFHSEEERSAHYERHFNMYRCKLGCVSTSSPSIWHMVHHVETNKCQLKKRSRDMQEDLIGAPKIWLDTLDPLDQFGSRITHRKINEVKKFEEEGKIERFVATPLELTSFRKWELCSYKSIRKFTMCVLCIVPIPEKDIEEHMRAYHSEDAGPHVCDICSRRFHSEEERRAHYERHFNMYRCKLTDCPYVTPSIKKIWYHVFRKERGLKVKSQIPDFHSVCDICGGTFKKKYFEVHYLQHVSKETYQCHDCGNVYNTRQQMLSHSYTHMKRFVCEECGYRTCFKHKLQQHATSHMAYEDRQFVCTLCEKRFTTKMKLIEHEQRHRGKSFLCAYCELTFANKYGLNHHVKLKHPDKVVEPTRRTGETQRRTKSAFRNPRVHFSLSPRIAAFSCDVCGKAFMTHARLVEHSIIHIKEVLHKCDECEKSFKFRKSLDVHLISHRGEKPYACDKCDKRYATHCTLKWHQESFHGEKKYICPICGFKVRYHTNLYRHMKKHSRRNKGIANNNSRVMEHDISLEDQEVVENVVKYETVSDMNYDQDNTSSGNEEASWINEEALRQERTCHAEAFDSKYDQASEEYVDFPRPAQIKVCKEMPNQPTEPYVRSEGAWELAAQRDRHRSLKKPRRSKHDPYTTQRGHSDRDPHLEPGYFKGQEYGGKTPQDIDQDPGETRGNPKEFRRTKSNMVNKRSMLTSHQEVRRSRFGGKHKPAFSVRHMPQLE